MPHMLSTQVGGKYHPDDNSVFRVKQALIRLGMSVSHPLADEIKVTNGEHGFAFDPAILVQSFCEVERHYYESIWASDFHTICNQFKRNFGYLGAVPVSRWPMLCATEGLSWFSTP